MLTKECSSSIFLCYSAIEYIFASVVTDENFLIFDGKLIKVVAEFLLKNTILCDKFKLFFAGESIDNSINSYILTYVLRTYSRIRGKDVTRKMMARMKNKVKLHT